MALLESIHESGIYRNETTQCFEAWKVNRESGSKVLLSTCSTCIPEEQYRWWQQQFLGNLLRSNGA